MEYIDSFLLGLIQGLTEFLPISSSGHLVLFRNLFSQDLEKGITFEVVVHFGTLCSILLYYRQKIKSLLTSLLRLFATPKKIGSKLEEDPNIALNGYILLSMLPAMVVGFTMKGYIEEMFMNPVMVSYMLLVTGFLLFFSQLRTYFPRNIGAGNSLMIGFAQALAIMPGISRSGSTISLGLYLGIDREEVANFSFLMVIPVIAGAMFVQIYEMVSLGVSYSALPDLMIGFVTAFISGYYALKYLILMLKKKGIHQFSWYCWIVGIAGLAYFGTF